MTARIVLLRLRTVTHVRSRPFSSPPVRVEWDFVRVLYVARCDRCADSLATPNATAADDWADTHRCDPELTALLTRITKRRAA
ncbi:hypothetical protein [Actinomadura flavalba]|uniref:hypothetical protein n=1 Tax=Actinomadura flavalba TaxID=1120938 RepID=UPI00036097BC|nr:hypothetical protein [Actinomadura flavalba]